MEVYTYGRKEFVQIRIGAHRFLRINFEIGSVFIFVYFLNST